MVIRAFLVEDNPDISNTLIESMEEMASLRFTGLAKTETAARRWLSANDGNWDLVIVDLFLGEGSGFGVLKDCRLRSARQKVVVLTNYVPANIVRHCRKLGADAVFDKSSDVEELVLYCRQHAANLDYINATSGTEITNANNGLITSPQNDSAAASDAMVRQYQTTIGPP